MNHSKNIQEKVKLYRINFIKNNNLSIQKNKKMKFQQNQQVVQKKQSKIKIFFKFLLGFIGSFFEYLAIESNKKNSIKLEQKLSSNVVNKSNSNKQTENLFQKEIEKNKYIEINVKKNAEKIMENKNTNIDSFQEPEKTTEKTTKKTAKKNIVNEKEQKNDLILIEEKVIYADTREDLNSAEAKIVKLKKDLILKKKNNTLIINKLIDEKNKYNNQNKNSKELPLIKSDENDYFLKNEKEILEKKEDVNADKNNNIFVEKDKIVNNFIDEKTEIFVESNIIVNKLIKRCDDDLTLVSEKREFFSLQEEFEKNLNNNKANIKINKKDLRKIKDNVLEIIDKQKSNLEQLNNFMSKSFDEKIVMLKFNNFFKSTAKLAFSFVPFFSFPNRIFGLATSALFFNRSIKSYRIKPNKNDINQSIRSMINNNEFCLRIGISNCNDSLNEIENIKYYLRNLSSEAKDSIEYRKYLLSVESTERLIQKQIEFMKNLSKKYEDIKIKVKKREN